jgi:UDP-3-O-[3-hydroxymyristoyl] glucosamine N-acyltransferase
LVGSKNKAHFIAPSAIILGNPDIGENTWIGHFTVLDASQGLVIGKNCSIASGVHIYTHSTHELVTESKEKLVGSVKIGDNVAIGANSVIMYDVSIGDNVCIPALTVIKPHTRIERNV